MASSIGHNSPKWTRMPATDTVPAYALLSQEIHKPQLDDREYRMIRLENGLLAILIHDGQADKAAACLTVAAGHMQDPDNVPGLAHFCEHMIKKGSTPYPEENDFLSFIFTNGGTQNASTSAAWQDYWFSINPSKLQGALSRLAAFFHSPLFLPSLTAREMHAVDSENKRNLQNDSRRIHQLDKSLSCAGHPWTKFGTGNVQTLTEAARKNLERDGQPTQVEDGDGGPVGRAVRERLLNWWEEEYCAGRMSLCVLGNESIDELTELAVLMFARIPNRGLAPRPVFDAPVWDRNQQGSLVFVRTVKDYHEFRVVFQIEDQAPVYRTSPAGFVSHFLGHEGPGSVYAFLKKRGWILDLSAGYSSKNPSVTPFTIGGRLTREGYMHYEEVVLAIFNYIALLRASDFEPYHFDEKKQMAATTFRFREKSQPHTYVRAVASSLLEAFEPEDILSGSALSQEWDEGAIRLLLSTMRPENARVMVMARDHDPAVAGKGDEWDVEKWYGTEYRVRRMSAAFIDQANLPNENNELILPRPNPYVPEDLSVNRRKVEEVMQAPLLIGESPLSKLWHKADDQFWVPKAQLRVHVKSPVTYSTPRNAVMSRLLVDLIEDSLSEITYDAELAGLRYSISSDTTGLTVAINGYSDKLQLLLGTVMETVTDIQPVEDRLKVKTEELERTYSNYYMGQPSNLAADFTSALLTTSVWTPAQKLSEMHNVTLADLDWHKRELLRKIHIETLITGNISNERALDISATIERHFRGVSLPQPEWPRDRSTLLPPGANWSTYAVRRMHDNPKETNSALVYHCQFGEVTNTRLRSTLRLLGHVLREPTFSQLRTVEQLGYVVSANLWISTGTIGLSFKIQSLKDPTYVEERVEAFIKNYRRTLASTSLETFTDWKEALATKLLEKPKNLAEETSQFWYQVRSGRYDFLRDETDARAVRVLDLEEVLAAYDEYLIPDVSASRKKLSYQLISQQLSADAQVAPANQVVVEDESLFKAGLACSAAALPMASSCSAYGISGVSRL
ncbi:LuxS/MPP-like metallohydrolase [Cytidiella melzeri]|nr:LuxS/MPP-like metallohydrolase [Cytidiella melzeri]